MNKYFLLCTHGKSTCSCIYECILKYMCILINIYHFFVGCQDIPQKQLTHTLVNLLFILYFFYFSFLSFSFPVKMGFHILAQAGFEVAM